MKVLFDHQAFTFQKFGGVSNYHAELMRHATNFEATLALKYTNNVYFKNQVQYKNHFLQFPNHTLNNILNRQLFKKINKLNSVIHILQNNFDVFHPTYYDSYFLNYLNKIPYFITVYDMIDEIFYPEDNEKKKLKKMKSKVILQAKKIIAISNKTKQDIIEIYKIPAEKIEVIYLASSLQKNIALAQNIKVDLPKKYILFIGNREGYKNFKVFIEAIKPLLNEDKNLYIICTGKYFTNAEISFFQNEGIEKQFIHFFIEDNELLAYLYQHAQFFIFPSIYEGFGIPILEAFHCGCPVLLSDTSCFPEIAQNAGYYFNPMDKESILQAVKTMLEKKDLREEYIQLGYKRVDFFSWEKTAEQTGILYRNSF